jgi:hypothetical protein
MRGALNVLDRAQLAAGLQVSLCFHVQNLPFRLGDQIELIFPPALS